MKHLRFSFFAALFLTLIVTAAFAAGVEAVAQTQGTATAQVWAELQNALLAAFYAALTAFGAAATGAVSTLAYKGWEMVKKWLAGTRQGQLFGILTDALEIAIAKQAAKQKTHYWDLIKDLARIFRDGKVDEAEKARLLAIRKEILDDAAQIAGEMIEECRGLAADQGVKYVSEKLDALLGELVFRLTGSSTALIPSSAGDSVATEN